MNKSDKAKLAKAIKFLGLLADKLEGSSDEHLLNQAISALDEFYSNHKAL